MNAAACIDDTFLDDDSIQMDPNVFDSGNDDTPY